jgi:hypothetical protein
MGCGTSYPVEKQLHPVHRAEATATTHTVMSSAAPQSGGLSARMASVCKHFPKALPIDDYMSRMEIALSGYGFTGENTIAMSNLCRDESVMLLEDKIESVFGACFSTHGLGGVLTCGVIGIKAGLSHSPLCKDGRERYAFFSFPHIGIDSDNNVGNISRPNRPGNSGACGALLGCLGTFKAEGLDPSCLKPGVHDPLDPEFTILKQRLARRLKHEGVDPSTLDLVSVTKASERFITSDLEFLIEKAVDPVKADYAVFTGVQIHNWASDLNNSAGVVPSLEFVSAGKSYVVINGQKTYLDIAQVPSLSPRQLRLLAMASQSVDDSLAAESTNTSTIQEIPRAFLMRRLGGANPNTKARSTAGTPGWSSYVKTEYDDQHPNSPNMASM